MERSVVMPWSRFEPGFSRHPKRLKVGPIASWLWVASVDHCTEFRTDGFLDAASIVTLCPTIKPAELKRHVEALIAIRSWEPVEGGYQVHGYLEHNQTARQVEADRQASKDRFLKWMSQRRSNAVANGVVQQESNGAANAVAAQLQRCSPSVSQSGTNYLEPPVSPTRSTTKRARRVQTGAPGIAHAIDSDSNRSPGAQETELAVLAAAMGITLEEARARQLEARERGRA
jgi:hypothetical protein